MAFPVADLAGFLAGAWRIERLIADLRANTVGRLQGTARFDPVPDGLDYAEQGVLTLGSYRGVATSRLHYAWDRSGCCQVCFPGGGVFHGLDLSSGVAQVAHDCAPDHYRGRYRAQGPGRWTLAWAIEGPRKRLLIGTRYVRTA